MGPNRFLSVCLGLAITITLAEQTDYKCPQEWGPQCKKPDWYCSEKIQCEKDEKCYKPMVCNEKGCKEDHEDNYKCVPKDLHLPCDYEPCADNPYKKCPPCGMDAHCMPIKRDMYYDSHEEGAYEGKEYEGKDDSDSHEEGAYEGKEYEGKDDSDSHEEGAYEGKEYEGKDDSDSHKKDESDSHEDGAYEGKEYEGKDDSDSHKKDESDSHEDGAYEGKEYEGKDDSDSHKKDESDSHEEGAYEGKDDSDSHKKDDSDSHEEGAYEGKEYEGKDDSDSHKKNDSDSHEDGAYEGKEYEGKDDSDSHKKDESDSHEDGAYEGKEYEGKDDSDSHKKDDSDSHEDGAYEGKEYEGKDDSDSHKKDDSDSHEEGAYEGKEYEGKDDSDSHKKDESDSHEDGAYEGKEYEGKDDSDSHKKNDSDSHEDGAYEGKEYEGKDDSDSHKKDESDSHEEGAYEGKEYEGKDDSDSHKKDDSDSHEEGAYEGKEYEGKDDSDSHKKDESDSHEDGAYKGKEYEGKDDSDSHKKDESDSHEEGAYEGKEYDGKDDSDSHKKNDSDSHKNDDSDSHEEGAYEGKEYEGKDDSVSHKKDDSDSHEEGAYEGKEYEGKDDSDSHKKNDSDSHKKDDSDSHEEGAYEGKEYEGKDDSVSHKKDDSDSHEEGAYEGKEYEGKDDSDSHKKNDSDSQKNDDSDSHEEGVYEGKEYEGKDDSVSHKKDDSDSHEEGAYEGKEYEGKDDSDSHKKNDSDSHKKDDSDSHEEGAYEGKEYEGKDDSDSHKKDESDSHEEGAYEGKEYEGKDDSDSHKKNDSDSHKKDDSDSHEEGAYEGKEYEGKDDSDSHKKDESDSHEEGAYEGKEYEGKDDSDSHKKNDSDSHKNDDSDSHEEGAYEGKEYEGKDDSDSHKKDDSDSHEEGAYEGKEYEGKDDSDSHKKDDSDSHEEGAYEGKEYEGKDDSDSHKKNDSDSHKKDDSDSHEEGAYEGKEYEGKDDSHSHKKDESDSHEEGAYEGKEYEGKDDSDSHKKDESDSHEEGAYEGKEYEGKDDSDSHKKDDSDSHEEGAYEGKEYEGKDDSDSHKKDESDSHEEGAYEGKEYEGKDDSGSHKKNDSDSHKKDDSDSHEEGAYEGKEYEGKDDSDSHEEGAYEGKEYEGKDDSDSHKKDDSDSHEEGAYEGKEYEGKDDSDSHKKDESDSHEEGAYEGKEYEGKDDSDSHKKDDSDSHEEGAYEGKDDSDSHKKDDSDSHEEGAYEGKEYEGKDGSDSHKKDESDSHEKGGYEEKGKNNFICRCPSGKSGMRCERNDKVCNILEMSKLKCDYGCIGDLGKGILCRCPKGFSGLLCDKPAYTPCQRSKLFYDDTMAVLKGKSKVARLNTDYFKQLVKRLTMAIESHTIPQLHCRPDGLYEKLQCEINIDTEAIQHCYCSDYHGEYVSSNIQPYISYPVCTGPADFKSHKGNVCSQSGICQNDGTCVFDLYKGKLCECKDGYHGLFCQHQGNTDYNPISFCNFMADSFSTLHHMSLNETDIFKPHFKMYWETAMMMIGTEKRTIKNFPRHLTAIKAECNPDGTFKPYLCDAYLPTGEIIACYCSNYKGPIVGTKAPDAKSLDCSATKNLCPKLHHCPHMKCAHGHRIDLNYCPMCECKEPCEGKMCGKGKRCVVKKEPHCDKMDGHCAKGVCMPMKKLGVCPGHKVSVYDSIITGRLDNKIDNDDHDDGDYYDKDMYGDENGSGMEGMRCQIDCRDDADCEGKKKCCGLCGNMCVEPKEPETCEDRYEMAMEKLELILDTKKNLVANMSRSLYLTLFHLSQTENVWIPKCNDKKYKPVQCMYSVDKLAEKKEMATDCFCVDRLGRKIMGSKASNKDDEASCRVKPYSCPAKNPMETEQFSRKEDKCDEDMDCAMGDKCCNNGFIKVCSKPVDAEKDQSSIDMVMQDLCNIMLDACKSGTCSGKWDSQGMACQCPLTRKGPFCMQTKAVFEKEMTVCQKKQYALEMFSARMTAYREAMYKGMTLESTGILAVLKKYIDKWTKEEKDKKYPVMSMINYHCDDEGDFLQMQCMHNIHTSVKTSCFCVDENGKELLGTRKPVSDGKPYCGYKEQMCKVGSPLHDDNGELTTCDRGSYCPGEGYACTRGMYGKLYCCPSKYKTDVCSLPSDVGIDCEDKSKKVVRYAYSYGKKCHSFEFKGCGGNKNSFMTMADCQRRCVDKIYEGECPMPFNINKNKNCKDSCDKDNECENDMFKCCQSSCGKHCVPSVSKMPLPGKCPFGHRFGDCIKNSECGEGNQCIIPEGESGFCCVNPSAVNLCSVYPRMDIDMKKMYRNDIGKHEPKDDMDSKDKDHSDSKDKDDDIDKDMYYDKSCMDPKPRFFYNPKKMRCEMYHGCKVDFNSFDNMEKCCHTCGSEARCKPGMCPKVKTDIILSCTSECDTDNDCDGEGICCSNGCAKICRLPMMEEGPSTCELGRMAAQRSMKTMEKGKCSISYVPSCEADKSWARHQCQMSLGVCWCVTDKGHYIYGTYTHGPAYCDDLDEITMQLADDHHQKVTDANERKICTDDKKIHCCNPAMCKKKCTAHPEAVCRMNPCGGCKAEFFDAMGTKMDCEEGLSDCEKELREVADLITAHQINAYKGSSEKRKQYIDNMKESNKIDKDVPMRCRHKPATGNCKQNVLKRWFYHPETKQCSMFLWGMCGGNENRFRTVDECYAVCNPSASPCAKTKCGTKNPHCTLLYAPDCYQQESLCTVTSTCSLKPNVNMPKGIFVPRCLASGSYNFKQCHKDYCWCVDSMGKYNGGLNHLYTYKDLQCDAQGPTDSSKVSATKCTDGSNPRVKCLKACTGKICPGQPEAMCKVDLCSDSCDTIFVDENNQNVKCNADDCSTFSFERDEGECESEVLCGGKDVKNCPSNVCEGAKEKLCPKNPCAMCKVDPCTCKPYFVDMVTKQRVSDGQCKFMMKSACHMKTCNVMTYMEEARFQGLDLDYIEPPQCDGNGKFEPKQCDGASCYCVKEDGTRTRDIGFDEKCKEFQETKKVKFTLSFDIDFNNYKDKMEEIKDNVRDVFIKKGIKSENIKVGKPYRGSLKVPVEIVQSEEEEEKQDLNIVANSIKQDIQSGNFAIEVDGKQLAANPTSSEFSQVYVNDGVDGDDGLSEKDKIIISIFTVAICLVLFILLVYCFCYKQRKKQDDVDDTIQLQRHPPQKPE